MRRVLVVIGLVVAVAIGLLWWLRGRDDGPVASKTATVSQTAAATHRAGGPRIPAKPATIGGRVIRKADGSGVAGAVVSLAPAELGADFVESKRPAIVVTSEASGVWLAKDVPPGEYVIAATATGLLPATMDKTTLASGEQRTGVDLALEAGGTLVRGTVSDVGGGPIESARVTAKRQAWSLSVDAELVALTGADGTYQLTLPDAEYRLAATHENYTGATRPLTVERKPATVDFTLIPGASVRGQVIARDSGEPVPHALVSAEGQRRSLRGDDSGGSIIADEHGEFVLHGLSSGAMSIEARGHGYASAQPTLVQLGIGEEVDGIQVLVDRAYSISGRVVKQGTQDGVAGARLGAFSMSQGMRAEAIDPSDERGAFEITGVRPGSYMLYAGAEGMVLEIGKNVEIVDKDVTDVIVELGSGVTVAGRVEPAAVASVSVELQGEVGLGNMFEMVKVMMCRAETDPSGAFALENVPPGKFHIVARTKEGRTGKAAVTVATVDQSGVVVQLEPRASIAGRVIDTTGKPVGDVRVVAELDEERRIRFSMTGIRPDTKTAADGTFKVVGLEPGTYDVRARMLDDWSEFSGGDKDKAHDKRRAKVELVAGAEKTGVTLTIDARDGVIRGQVVGADRKPVADAWVTARRELDTPTGLPDKVASQLSFLGDSEPVLTNERGQFTIGKLRKGSYTLVAEGPRGSSRGEKHGVKSGDGATIELASLGTLIVAVTQGGKPVTGYDVSCASPAGDIERHASAADGTYKLGPLAPGDYTCHVRAASGFAEGKVSVPPGEAKLALSLGAWGSLTGTVVSVLTGKPVPGLAVVADSAGTDGFVEVFAGRAPKTDANGRFTVERVAPGKGALMLMPPDGGMSSMESHDYTAKAGERVDLGRIEIVPPRVGDAGTFGLATEADGELLKVTSVKDGGPAAQAGIVVGDKITALAGQPVKALTPTLAQKLIASGSIGVGQTVTVTLERGTTVELTSIKW